MKIRKSFVAIAISLLLASSLIASPLTSFQCWSCMTDQQRNDLILNRARSEIGINYANTSYGTCKKWAIKAVQDVGGPMLPFNFTNSSADPTYYNARWYDSQHIVIWQGAYYCPASFMYHGIVPGNIVQMRLGTSGIHTAIIESVSSTSMTWIDCNWQFDSVVRRHTVSLSWWAGSVTAWTVYQIK